MKPVVDLRFPHPWHAEILSARPLILPPRHFVYPREAEEVERGALEVLIKPGQVEPGQVEPRQPGAPGPASATGDQPFLATCALGFRDPIVPTGIWSAPNPQEICAVSGGYAYIIDTTSPQRFTMIPYRPVLEIHPVPSENILLFVGHHSVLAWGTAGHIWQSEKLSDEGITLGAIEDGVIRGRGWEMLSDSEKPFSIDLKTGRKLT